MHGVVGAGLLDRFGRRAHRANHDLDVGVVGGGALDELLAPLHLSVQQLKAEERYAEDVF